MPKKVICTYGLSAEVLKGAFTSIAFLFYVVQCNQNRETVSVHGSVLHEVTFAQVVYFTATNLAELNTINKFESLFLLHFVYLLICSRY